MAHNERNRPSLTPGVGSSYRNGWRQLWKYFLVLFLIGIIGTLVSTPFHIGQWAGGLSGELADQLDFGRVAISSIPSIFSFTVLGFLGTVWGILVTGPVEYGISFAYLKAARGDNLEFTNMFDVFKNYWNAVLASLLVFVIVGIGFVLLIVPGIVFACKLAFTRYLVVDQKMAVIEAVKESWRMTRGHAWRIFLIGLLGIPICVVGLLCLGVGIIISIMWISLAFASLYHAVVISAEASGQTQGNHS